MYMYKCVLLGLLLSPLATTPAFSNDPKGGSSAALSPITDWDVGFGAGLASDYNVRGIAASNHKPSGTAYFEPRYNFYPNWQLYAGVGAESISFPNGATTEADFYGGIRPSIGSLTLDLGLWYYDFLGGSTYSGVFPSCTNSASATASACNADKANMSSWEAFSKNTYPLNDRVTIGANIFYSPSWLNSGAYGLYASSSLRLLMPEILPSIGSPYLSGELGHYWFGTTDSFYGIPGTQFSGGIPYPAYTTWNVGIGVNRGAFTLDMRYYDTNLSKANCNVLTADYTATFGASNVIPTNPSGLGSDWCGAAYIAKFSVDLTLNAIRKQNP
jgi:uncharacterized protein (TIGR02001 family)